MVYDTVVYHYNIYNILYIIVDYHYNIIYIYIYIL